MRVQSAAVVAIAIVPMMAAAQQFLPNFGPPVDPNTRFEVVAITAFDGGSGQVLMRMTPGRFDSTVPVGTLLRQALQKPDYQIVSAPGWVDSERYSIVAKAPEGVPPAAISVRLGGPEGSPQRSGGGRLGLPRRALHLHFAERDC